MEWETELHALGLVAVAGGLGALIGVEREIWDKPAGLKTHIFVCAASALLMLLGDAVLESFKDQQGHDAIRGDPIRVIQAIVIGISFLGTGTIIHQSGNRVEGLTTASTIFLTAGIGIAVAVEHLILATGTAVFGLIVLVGVGWLERFLPKRD